MANVICLICLRTDITAVKIATELADFIDELCDYSIIENPRYKYCTVCAHLLKKFYNFKQRCLKACKILKSIKGKPKILPTDLHKQIPSSIGPCTTLARYKVLEHQHGTDTDLLETKPDLTNEPNITPNNAEVYIKLNLENTDPIPPDPIEVKDEPMHDALDSDIGTMQVADGENNYMITTSNGYLTIDSNFKKDTCSIKLEADNEELNTDANKDVLKNNTNQSKINDYLKSFEDEIKEFEDNSVEEDNTDIKDTSFMLNNDPLRDDESLNSNDDIESDISGCDVESLPLDEHDSEKDSDLESLSEILEKAKDKKIKVNEINDLELAEILLKIDKKNKLLKKRVAFLKDNIKIKDGILKYFKNDEYDLGDGVKLSKESFLKIYERGEKTSCNHLNTFNFKDTLDQQRTEALLRTLHKMYNPEYDTVFDIEYLVTEEKKLQEFNRRKERAEYQSAPYKCERCYKGFQAERLRAYHMKGHDESSGPHACHICSLRFQTRIRERAHANYCHSALYVCRLCGISFYYFSSMLNHYNLHKGAEYTCPICKGIYRTLTGLSNHKRTHVTSHICTTCARSFVSAKGLHFHRKVKHKGEPEQSGAGSVRCAECALTLDSQLAYKKHMRISHRSRRFVCRCSKGFSSMAELRQHRVDEGHQRSIRNSAGEVSLFLKGKKDRPATKTCPTCQEEVPNNGPFGMYKHHASYHPGVPYRPACKGYDTYLCEDCGKQFMAESAFRDHKNTHTGARPYACPECPRAFASAPNLWQHSAWHRPPTHKCKQCGKLFKAASNLGAHMRIHKNDRRYICDVCSASFIHAASLTSHIKGVHQQQRRIRKHKKTS